MFQWNLSDSLEWDCFFMRESIRTIQYAQFLNERDKILDSKLRSLFDFLFMTGARVSEALMVKTTDLDWESLKVNLHTLKNPSDPYRSVKLFPDNDLDLINSIKSWVEGIPIGERVWSFPERKVRPDMRVRLLSKFYFGCTTHSFRHTNATLFCRAVRPNLHALMGRYGWKDPKPALIYIKYSFDKELDEKIKEFHEKGGKL